jgi:hypothetical protein
MLDTNSVGKLNDFLHQCCERSALERTNALLGQSYLSRVMYCQINDVALALSEDFDVTKNIIHIMGHYIQKLIFFGRKQHLKVFMIWRTMMAIKMRRTTTCHGTLLVQMMILRSLTTTRVCWLLYSVKEPGVRLSLCENLKQRTNYHSSIDTRKRPPHPNSSAPHVLLVTFL